MTAAKRSAQDAVVDAVTAEGDRTVDELAAAAGIGRSTAGKVLVALEQAGNVQRVAGGREGARRLPDRWSVAVADKPVTPSTGETDDVRADDRMHQDVGTSRAAGETAEQNAATGGARTAVEAAGRLRPGQLDGLVLDYLTSHAGEGPVGPGAVAKALGRSSGAVGNCLARLASRGTVRQVGERPRRYGLG